MRRQTGTWVAIVALVVGSAAPVAWGQLIVNVVETGGDNEPTDTITAKWTGQTFPVSVANEPVPGAVVGTNYTVPTFGSGAPAYVDRGNRYFDDAPNSLPVLAYLTGAEYIISGNDNRDNASYRLDVTVSQPVTAYMLIDNRLSDGDSSNPPTFDPTHMQWILDQGWLATSNGLNRAGSAARPDEVPLDESSDGDIDQWYSVYSKTFPAGTFSLFQPDNSGRNMYGVVITPEPAACLLGLAVFGFTRRRRC